MVLTPLIEGSIIPVRNRRGRPPGRARFSAGRDGRVSAGIHHYNGWIMTAESATDLWNLPWRW